MTEVEELLEELSDLCDRLDTYASVIGSPAPLVEAKVALEEAIDKIEDYVNAA